MVPQQTSWRRRPITKFNHACDTLLFSCFYPFFLSFVSFFIPPHFPPCFLPTFLFHSLSPSSSVFLLGDTGGIQSGSRRSEEAGCVPSASSRHRLPNYAICSPPTPTPILKASQASFQHSHTWPAKEMEGRAAISTTERGQQ